MNYTKKAEVDSASSVTIYVFDENGNNRGDRYFIYGFFNQNSNKALEKRLAKAHKWADERIKTLEEGV